MNVLKCYPMTKRYYLLHPWEIISQTFTNFKHGWQRVTRGFADCDTWNLDDYILDLIPEMVEHLKENTHGFPCMEFPSHEAWQNYLHNEIVIPLRNARSDQKEQLNEYEYIYEKYPIRIENNTIVDNIPQEELLKWTKREEEIFEWRDKQRMLGFSALLREDIYHHLWD